MKHKMIKSIMMAGATTAIAVLPLCSCATMNEMNLVAKNNGKTTDKAFKVDKLHKYNGSVYQNSWTFDNKEISKHSETTTVPSNQFQGNTQLEHVFYDSNDGNTKIEAIEDQAFQGCSNLTSVAFPTTTDTNGNSVGVTVGKRAFFRCSNLKQIDLTALGNSAAALKTWAKNVGEDAFKGIYGDDETGGIWKIDNTECTIFKTKDGEPYGEIEAVQDDALEDMKAFKEALIAKGVPEGWFKKWNIKTNVSPTKKETIGGKEYTVWDWTNINSVAEKYEKSEQTEADLTKVATSLGYSQITDLVGLGGETGKEIYMNVNSQPHKVRIIGYNHDILASDSTKKAALTFEFANLISDSSGAKITQKFNASYSSPYFNIWNNGSQSCDLRNWLRNESTGFLSLIPSELKSAIKTVKKKTSAGNKSATVNELDESVFVLSLHELCSETSIDGYHSSSLSASDKAVYKQEGIQYKFYADNLPNTDPYDWDSTLTTAKKEFIIKKDVAGTAYYYWLRSPSVYDTNLAWYVDSNGFVDFNYVNGAFAVAPCFCI